jgi:mannose-6-phosphate isomerase-like protein (cupin superfamily)
VIAGRGRWFIGDETIDAGPGDFVHGPHRIAHASTPTICMCW